KWNGSTILRVSLADLGFKLVFGHGDVLCPHTYDDTGIQVITVLDITGVHIVKIAWCHCADAPMPAEQLLSCKWFPATILRPRTSVTFRALKLFHLLSHVVQTNPWDFAGTMHWMTDNVCPFSVTNIYKLFKHIQRQWRVVKAWKRAGVRDPSLPRNSGSLAIFCVSCPIPGVSLKPGWEKEPERYVSICGEWAGAEFFQ
ncbi:hypothetical protein M422DRAFT_197387, partial [Sphaerobolus stellatus SS14]